MLDATLGVDQTGVSRYLGLGKRASDGLLPAPGRMRQKIRESGPLGISPGILGLGAPRGAESRGGGGGASSQNLPHGACFRDAAPEGETGGRNSPGTVPPPVPFSAPSSRLVIVVLAPSCINLHIVLSGSGLFGSFTGGDFLPHAAVLCGRTLPTRTRGRH